MYLTTDCHQINTCTIYFKSDVAVFSGFQYNVYLLYNLFYLHIFCNQLYLSLTVCSVLVFYLTVFISSYLRRHSLKNAFYLIYSNINYYSFFLALKFFNLSAEMCEIRMLSHFYKLLTNWPSIIYHIKFFLVNMPLSYSLSSFKHFLEILLYSEWYIFLNPWPLHFKIIIAFNYILTYQRIAQLCYFNIIPNTFAHL